MLDVRIDQQALEDLEAHLQGQLIFPSDDNYDKARRVWNGMIDRYPALIARCANAADVASVVRFAQSQHLPASVRGGGHNVAGISVCDGGILIDLSLMKAIQVDPTTQTVWAGAGLLLGEFVRETQMFGLGTTVGTNSLTGLSGLTLGGGIGWLMGKYGLTVDSLLAVDIVTADGQVRRASATEHPDLFWGVRGGGGNFGVVTSFMFQLHPVGTLLAGMVVHPMARAREVLRFYREYTSNAPDELTSLTIFATMPDGLAAVIIALCYCGPLDEGERVIAPVRNFGAPLVDLIQPMSYLDLTTMIDMTAPDGRCYYDKSSTLKGELSDEAIDTLIASASSFTSPFSQVLIPHVHGAACRIAPTATAVAALRDEAYVIGIIAAWEKSEARQHIEWARAFWEAMEPFATGGVYINFLNDEKEERIRASYGINYDRLVALKNTYDPTNFFHLNQNIKPTV